MESKVIQSFIELQNPVGGIPQARMEVNLGSVSVAFAAQQCDTERKSARAGLSPHKKTYNCNYIWYAVGIYRTTN